MRRISALPGQNIFRLVRLLSSRQRTLRVRMRSRDDIPLQREKFAAKSNLHRAHMSLCRQTLRDSLLGCLCFSPSRLTSKSLTQIEQTPGQPAPQHSRPWNSGSEPRVRFQCVEVRLQVQQRCNLPCKPLKKAFSPRKVNFLQENCIGSHWSHAVGSRTFCRRQAAVHETGGSV